MKNKFSNVVLLAMAVSFVSHNAFSKDQDDADKWGTYVRIKNKNYNQFDEKSKSEVLLFIPVSQNKGKSLLFMDLRTVLTGDHSKNLSLGFGFRKKLDKDSIMGMHASVDKRQSSRVEGQENYQTSLGIEYLKEDFEVGLNLYLPLKEEKREVSNSIVNISPYLVGNKAYMDLLSQFIDETQYNFGTELMFNTKLSQRQSHQLWVDAKVYEYDSKSSNDLRGYQIGLSMRSDFEAGNFDFSSDLGAGVRDTSLEKRDNFVSAELRTYFGKRSKSRKIHSGNSLDYKMDSPIERNTSIPAYTETRDISKTVQAQITVGSKTYDEISAIVDADSFINEISNAGENSLVLVDGEAGDFILNELLDVQNGQTLAGGGTPVVLTGPNGEQAVLILPGESADVYSLPKNGLNLLGNSSLVNVDEFKVDPKINNFDNEIVNGSFEDTPITVDSEGGTRWWGVFDAINGWQTDLEASNAPIEIQHGIVAPATDGFNILELDSHNFRRGGYTDSNSHVYQNVKTEKGKAYLLTFDYSARVNGNAETNKASVYWEGNKILDLNSVERVWDQKQILIRANSNDLSKLEFRGEGTEDTYGALIDNVRLERLNE